MVLSGVRPLRRRLFCGGCSRVEYQQIAAAAFFAAPSTDPLLRVVLERCGGGDGGLVFGTLLGPETTVPWHVFRCSLTGERRGAVVWDLCFWFPGCTERTCCVCGVCGTGLLFENYIVDASIFYKKQFPRI